MKPREILTARLWSHRRYKQAALVLYSKYRILCSRLLTGGGVTRCPGMQAGSRRVSARPGEAVDVVLKGPSELLRARRFPLLL